jgi:transcriptional regulator with XRE-family HTH domain
MSVLPTRQLGRESSSVLNVTLARRRRKELGLTMSQVGQLCGVGTDVISRWEAGLREPKNVDSLRAWARALKIDPADLLADPEPEPAGERSA